MSDAERVHHSLATRVFRVSMMGSIALGVVTLVIGLALYTTMLTGQYIGQAVGVTPSAKASVAHGVNTIEIAKETMSIYHSLSPEERGKVGTEEYRSWFSHLENEDEFSRLMNILRSFVVSSGVDDVYVAMYDRETSALVYIADPDENPKTKIFPGEWESVKADEIEKLLGWDGKGDLYDISIEKKYGWICTAGTPSGIRTERLWPLCSLT